MDRQQNAWTDNRTQEETTEHTVRQQNTRADNRTHGHIRPHLENDAEMKPPGMNMGKGEGRDHDREVRGVNTTGR